MIGYHDLVTYPLKQFPDFHERRKIHTPAGFIYFWDEANMTITLMWNCDRYSNKVLGVKTYMGLVETKLTQAQEALKSWLA